MMKNLRSILAEEGLTASKSSLSDSDLAVRMQDLSDIEEDVGQLTREQEDEWSDLSSEQERRSLERREQKAKEDLKLVLRAVKGPKTKKLLLRQESDSVYHPGYIVDQGPRSYGKWLDAMIVHHLIDNIDYTTVLRRLPSIRRKVKNLGYATVQDAYEVGARTLWDIVF